MEEIFANNMSDNGPGSRIDGPLNLNNENINNPIKIWQINKCFSKEDIQMVKKKQIKNKKKKNT